MAQMGCFSNDNNDQGLVERTGEKRKAYRDWWDRQKERKQ
jgi:hypothetical protein